MAINFPTGPALGTIFNSGTNSWIYQTSGTINAWEKTSPGIVKTMADTPPLLPIEGQEWTDTRSMKDYTWYEDGSSSQWVQQEEGIIPAPLSVAFKEQGGKIWTSGTEYKYGDIVLDTTTMLAYFCNTDHTSGSWGSDTANWTKISIEEAPEDGKVY